MTVKAYCRCNSGHYFLGEHCPFDGWASPASEELTRAVAALLRAGREPTVTNLRALGVSEATLARVIAIEFGSADSMFEAIAPAGYCAEGRWAPLHKSDRRFM